MQHLLVAKRQSEFGDGEGIMAWNTADERQEHHRRVDAAIARASACHMSNTKWFEFFAVLRHLDIWPLRWKFVRQDGVAACPAPRESGLCADGLGDVMPYPYCPFREIEWVEVPSEHAVGLVEALAAVGQFPVQLLASGVRVVGYSWQSPEAEQDSAQDQQRRQIHGQRR
jgi:hypothetical protein